MEGLLTALAGPTKTVRIWDWRREYRAGDPRSQGDVPTGPHSLPRALRTEPSVRCQRPSLPPRVFNDEASLRVLVP